LKARRSLGVTGTPCTGKKSVSPILASILGMAPVDINVVARASHPGEREAAGGELAVDTRVVRSALLKRGLDDVLISGHLLADVLARGELEFVAVLRCEPLVLKKRLLARGYAHAKVVENVEAELIGVVLDAAVRTFGKTRVHEYDTTEENPQVVARRIAGDYRSRARQGQPWRDWTLDYDSSTKLRALFVSEGERRAPAST